MALPIRTTLDDIQAVCGYLANKSTGATVKEARTVLDKKYLDGRKLSALTAWGLIEESEGRYKATSSGRAVAKDSGAGKAHILATVIRSIDPYRSIIERAAHRNEESLSATDVAAHWHEHFRDQASDKEKTLNDQAVCFFQLATGAELGELVVGRRGSPTRIDFNSTAIENFVRGQGVSQPDSRSLHGDETPTPPQTPTDISLDEPPTGELGPGPPELGQAIFIAHGKNKRPLEQLKKILEQFRIPYKVAVDEPNLGRPIGAKVREIMHSCNCAILIFTADQELKDKDGNEIWRANENVAYELGAAGYLYDSRIVILKEEAVTFPSNFQDIGHISFEHDKLDSEAMEILKELIGFGIVKIST